MALVNPHTPVVSITLRIKSKPLAPISRSVLCSCLLYPYLLTLPRNLVHRCRPEWEPLECRHLREALPDLTQPRLRAAILDPAHILSVISHKCLIIFSVFV